MYVVSLLGGCSFLSFRKKKEKNQKKENKFRRISFAGGYFKVSILFCIVEDAS